MGKAKSRNGQAFKKPKLNIAFDPQARIEYLSGFHKRKLERKAHHKAKLVRQVAEEKQRIREKVKQSAGKVSSSHSILPEVEALLGLSNKNAESTPKLLNTFVMGSKVVTVSSLDNIHIKPADIENSDDDHMDDIPDEKNTTSSISKKAANRMLQHSKAFKAQQRLKQKSKKSRGQKAKKGRKEKGRSAEKNAAPETGAQPRRRKGQTRQKKLAGKR